MFVSIHIFINTLYKKDRESAVKHVDILKRNVPVEGHVRVMMVTEKQYSKMVLLTGSKSHQESSINSDAFIII